MKRLYLDHCPGDEFTLDGPAQHYLKNVLRMAAGERIGILTPAELLEAEVLSMGKRSATLTVRNRTAAKKTDYSLRVYQCLLKREYMDTVVEKLTELGVTEIVPVLSAHSLPILKDTALARFREIAKVATLQSEHSFLPHFTDAVKINSITASNNADNFLFYERGEISSPVLTGRDINLVIGPEGGFTEDEVSLLRGRGFIVCTPLSSILKAETAAVVFTGWVRIRL